MRHPQQPAEYDLRHGLAVRRPDCAEDGLGEQVVLDTEDPLVAHAARAADFVSAERRTYVDELEARVGGLALDHGVGVVGHGVDPLASRLGRGQTCGAVVEEMRVAGDDDLGLRCALADGLVGRGEPLRQVVVDDLLGVVERSGARRVVDQRQDAAEDHAFEVRVVAADGEGDQGGVGARR